MPGIWEAKYPNFAVGNRGKLAPSNRRLENAADWESPPATSHLKAYRFNSFQKTLDEEGLEFVSRSQDIDFEGEAAADPDVQDTDVTSTIEVQFKPSGRRGVTWYKYFFSDPEDAEVKWAMLRNASQPGKVIYWVFIKQAIPYERIS